MLLSLPTVIGRTTPGKSTVFLSGKTGKSLGNSLSFNESLSLSFKGIMGMNSISSSVLRKIFGCFIFRLDDKIAPVRQKSYYFFMAYIGFNFGASISRPAQYKKPPWHSG